MKFTSNWIVCPLLRGNFAYWHHYESCSRHESLQTSPGSCSYFVVSQIVKMKPLIKSSAYYWTSNTLHHTTYKYLSQTVCFLIFGKYILFHQLTIAQFGFLHWYVVTFFCHQKLQCWMQDGHKCKIIISKNYIQVFTSEIMKEYIQDNRY